MTLQEIIEWLKSIKEKYIHGGDEDFDKKRKIAIDIAISALEKRIPKKIDGKDEDDLVCGCHRCGEVNALWKMNGDRNNYCGNCGQAIDWSDTE